MSSLPPTEVHGPASSCSWMVLAYGQPCSTWRSGSPMAATSFCCLICSTGSGLSAARSRKGVCHRQCAESHCGDNRPPYRFRAGSQRHRQLYSLPSQSSRCRGTGLRRNRILHGRSLLAGVRRRLPRSDRCRRQLSRRESSHLLAVSPHLLAPAMRASVYVAAAEDDPSYPPEMAAQLEQALTSAGVNHICEVYEGAAHGWTMPTRRAITTRPPNAIGAVCSISSA